MKPQVQESHYYNGYDSKQRFCSYWTQIEWVMKLGDFPVLEVGVGNRLVNDYLRRLYIPVTTIDIAEDLSPDYVGSVHEMPFKDGSFGTVMACQVLEHLPFDLLSVALSEIARVTSRYAVISLPNVGRTYPVQVFLPKLGRKQWLFDLSSPLPRKDSVLSEEHYWEIGRKGYPVERIISVMEQAGFTVLEHHRVFEFAYHHFFILDRSISVNL